MPLLAEMLSLFCMTPPTPAPPRCRKTATVHRTEQHHRHSVQQKAQPNPAPVLLTSQFGHLKTERIGFPAAPQMHKTKYIVCGATEIHQSYISQVCKLAAFIF